MLAVVSYKKGVSGKKYRIATDDDTKTFKNAEKSLDEKRKHLMSKWGFDPAPDEYIHTPNKKEYTPGSLLYNFTPVMLYGMTRWGDLFNPRQKLALVTLVEKVRLAHSEMLERGIDATWTPCAGCKQKCRWLMPNGEIAKCYAETCAEGLASKAYPNGWLASSRA